jgi:hypothetical protein
VHFLEFRVLLGCQDPMDAIEHQRPVLAELGAGRLDSVDLG